MSKEETSGIEKKLTELVISQKYTNTLLRRIHVLLKAILDDRDLLSEVEKSIIFGGSKSEN
ncbi:hypothetical protein N9M26_01010 [Alphaproteobacteria bacterium]|jgi:hypothetical protein|nr:hypothetical protein [Alphaproteobacteria bacterium]